MTQDLCITMKIYCRLSSCGCHAHLSWLTIIEAENMYNDRQLFTKFPSIHINNKINGVKMLLFYLVAHTIPPIFYTSYWKSLKTKKKNFFHLKWIPNIRFSFISHRRREKRQIKFFKTNRKCQSQMKLFHFIFMRGSWWKTAARRWKES